VRIAFGNNKYNYTQMFKNNYNIISIDLSGVSYSDIKDTSAMFLATFFACLVCLSLVMMLSSLFYLS
jgi:hypothetical protein